MLNLSGTQAAKMTRAALIGAMYVALTYLSSLFGLSSGVIQVRISEALLVLPAFLPEAVPGLFIGCVISNILTGCMPWDIVFGSLATLIGAYGAYLMRKLPYKLGWLTTLPNIISNALIVPFVLILVYGAEDEYWFILATVTLGEVIAGGIFGTVLYYGLYKLFRK